MIAQLAALAVGFVCVVAAAWLLLRWGRAGSQVVDAHVDAALERARARHPASRCPICGGRVTGPAVEHICESA